MYSVKLRASGGGSSYKWNANTLPAGLSLDKDSGEISGTPAAKTAKQSYTVTLTDSKGKTDTAEFELTLL
jgi:streptogrisin C